MKRMNIAFVSDAVAPFNKGGKETRIAHLTQELVKLGQEVHIYTMHWWEGGKTYELNGITYHAISRLYPLYAGDRRSIRQGLLFGLACLKLVRYKFDILEVDHMPFFPLYAAKLVSLVKRRPLYATWHEVWGRQYWHEYLGGWKAEVATLIERFSVRLPDHIAAVSVHTQKQLRTVLKYKGRVSLIGNGINYYQIAPVKSSRRKSDVVYTGRLLPHKNVDLLVKAIAELKVTRPGIRCFIIGQGPQAAELRLLIDQLGLKRNVVLLGRVEANDTLYGLMKASKVFVLPSSREGFGITVLEAFACGLSVVTVNCRDNAAQYLVSDDLGIVCSPSPAAVAAALDSLLNVCDKVDARHAEQYDWSNAAQALHEVYQS